MAELKKKVLGVDFDDVLFEYYPGLCRFHNTVYGTAHTLDDMRMGMHTVWNVSEEEMKRRMLEYYEHDIHFSQPPVDGAVEAIARLSQEHSIILVTSRPEYIKEGTLSWLHKYFPKEHFDGIHFTNLFAGKAEDKVKKKSEVCRELGIEVFIDDFVHNALDVADVCKKVFLLDKPWNREVELPGNVQRVYSWPEILESLS